MEKASLRATQILLEEAKLDPTPPPTWAVRRIGTETYAKVGSRGIRREGAAERPGSVRGRSG